MTVVDVFAPDLATLPQRGSSLDSLDSAVIHHAPSLPLMHPRQEVVATKRLDASSILRGFRASSTTKLGHPRLPSLLRENSVTRLMQRGGRVAEDAGRATKSPPAAVSRSADAANGHVASLTLLEDLTTLSEVSADETSDRSDFSPFGADESPSALTAPMVGSSETPPPERKSPPLKKSPPLSLTKMSPPEGTSSASASAGIRPPREIHFPPSAHPASEMGSAMKEMTTSDKKRPPPPPDRSPLFGHFGERYSPRPEDAEGVPLDGRSAALAELSHIQEKFETEWKDFERSKELILGGQDGGRQFFRISKQSPGVADRVEKEEPLVTPVREDEKKTKETDSKVIARLFSRSSGAAHAKEGRGGATRGRTVSRAALPPLTLSRPARLEDSHSQYARPTIARGSKDGAAAMEISLGPPKAQKISRPLSSMT